MIKIYSNLKPIIRITALALVCTIFLSDISFASGFEKGDKLSPALHSKPICSVVENADGSYGVEEGDMSDGREDWLFWEVSYMIAGAVKLRLSEDVTRTLIRRHLKKRHAEGENRLWGCDLGTLRAKVSGDRILSYSYIVRHINGEKYRLVYTSEPNGRQILFTIPIPDGNETLNVYAVKEDLDPNGTKSANETLSASEEEAADNKAPSGNGISIPDIAGTESALQDGEKEKQAVLKNDHTSLPGFFGWAVEKMRSKGWLEKKWANRLAAFIFGFEEIFFSLTMISGYKWLWDTVCHTQSTGVLFYSALFVYPILSGLVHMEKGRVYRMKEGKIVLQHAEPGDRFWIMFWSAITGTIYLLVILNLKFGMWNIPIALGAVILWHGFFDAFLAEAGNFPLMAVPPGIRTRPDGQDKDLSLGERLYVRLPESFYSFLSWYAFITMTAAGLCFSFNISFFYSFLAVFAAVGIHEIAGHGGAAAYLSMRGKVKRISFVIFTGWPGTRYMLRHLFSISMDTEKNITIAGPAANLIAALIGFILYLAGWAAGGHLYAFICVNLGIGVLSLMPFSSDGMRLMLIKTTNTVLYDAVSNYSALRSGEVRINYSSEDTFFIRVNGKIFWITRDYIVEAYKDKNDHNKMADIPQVIMNDYGKKFNVTLKVKLLKTDNGAKYFLSRDENYGVLEVTDMPLLWKERDLVLNMDIRPNRKYPDAIPGDIRSGDIQSPGVNTVPPGEKIPAGIAKKAKKKNNPKKIDILRITADKNAIRFKDYASLTQDRDEKKISYIAVNREWMKPYTQGNPQYTYINRLITGVRRYCKTKNIEFICDTKETVADKIDSIKTRDPGAKGLILADKDTLDMVEDVLKSHKIHGYADTFFAEIDGSNIGVDSYIRLPELLGMALEALFANDTEKDILESDMRKRHPKIFVQIISKNRIVLLPSGEPLDIEKLKPAYSVTVFA